jgi:hypothetical protein
MTEQFANLARTTFAAALAAVAPGTSEVIQVASAELLPPGPTYRLVAKGEIMLVTATNGVKPTVTRGAEGTTPVAHAVGDKVTHILTKGALAAFASDVETAAEAAAAADVATEAAARTAADALLIPFTQKGANSGVATLDGAGLLPTSQLPPLALTDPHVVGSEAAQLALTVHEGTFAIRTDINKTFVQNGGTSKTMADWTEIITPGDVQSVNGHTGIVALTNVDVGADVAGAAAAEATRASAAEALKAPLASPALTGTPTAPTAGENDNSTKLATTAYTDRAADEAREDAEAADANRPKSLGEVEGAITPNLTEGNIFELTVKGDTTLEKPTNWPAGYSEQLAIVKQNGAGAHKVTFGAGLTLVGGPVNTEPNAVSVFNLISQDGGATVYAVNAVQGQEGVRGEQGVEGPRGLTGEVGPVGPAGAVGATEALGNVTGVVKLNLAEALAFTMTVTGNLTVEFENWHAGLSEPELYITQDATGGHTITIPGVTWQNEAPELSTAPNALNIVPLSSPDGGVHIYGMRGQRGATGAVGEKGEKGATGAEGKAGAWTAITPGAKVQAVTTEETPTCEVRTEQGSASARLRGNLEVKAGEELKIGEKLLTLPVGARPASTVVLQTGFASTITGNATAVTLIIKPSGVVTLASAATAGKIVHLDFAFPLT